MFIRIWIRFIAPSVCPFVIYVLEDILTFVRRSTLRYHMMTRLHGGKVEHHRHLFTLRITIIVCLLLRLTRLFLLFFRCVQKDQNHRWAYSIARGGGAWNLTFAMSNVVPRLTTKRHEKNNINIKHIAIFQLHRAHFCISSLSLSFAMLYKWSSRRGFGCSCSWNSIEVGKLSKIRWWRKKVVIWVNSKNHESVCIAHLLICRHVCGPAAYRTTYTAATKRRSTASRRREATECSNSSARVEPPARWHIQLLVRKVSETTSRMREREINEHRLNY